MSQSLGYFSITMSFGISDYYKLYICEDENPSCKYSLSVRPVTFNNYDPYEYILTEFLMETFYRQKLFFSLCNTDYPKAWPVS
jgi:hypothetical protein